VQVPLPGIDPQQVTLEAAATRRASAPRCRRAEGRRSQIRYQQTPTVPQFLDVERLTATHQHGLLQLTLPLKESVRRRRIQIDARGGEQRIEGKGIEAPQLAGAGAGR
jgi:HSP20 family protein